MLVYQHSPRQLQLATFQKINIGMHPGCEADVSAFDPLAGIGNYRAGPPVPIVNDLFQLGG